MTHFAFPQIALRSWRWKTLTAVAGFSFALSGAGTASGQIAASTEPVRVALTPAAYLPVVSKGSIQTTIATDLGGQSTAEPWRVSLLSLGRRSRTGGLAYSVQMTNTSSASRNLPVGTDGQAIWDACQKNEISEVNISLRIAGQVAPAANLPIVHSCASLSSSNVAVAPGASVVFQGTLSGSLLLPQGAEVSAVVSLCSASYNLDASSPGTTRHCEVPVASGSVTQSALFRGVAPQPRVR